MTLLLDSLTVQGKNIKVTGGFKIDSDNLGGQTSSTASNLKGFKPTTLTVSLQIPYKNKEQLQSLINIARTVSTGGKRKVYRIVNETAAAFGMKQVQFTDNFSARQDDVLKQWQIQFNLTEYVSVPERTENRQAANKVEQQTTPGVAVEDDNPETIELTSAEKVLKRINDKIGEWWFK